MKARCILILTCLATCAMAAPRVGPPINFGHVRLYFNKEIPMRYADGDALGEGESVACVLASPETGTEALTKESKPPFSFDANGNLIKEEGYIVELLKFGTRPITQLPEGGIPADYRFTLQSSETLPSDKDYAVYWITFDTRDEAGRCDGSFPARLSAYGISYCGITGGGQAGLKDCDVAIGTGWTPSKEEARNVALTPLTALILDGKTVTEKNEIEAALTPAISAFEMEDFSLTLQPSPMPNKVLYTVETAEHLDGEWQSLSDVLRQLPEEQKKNLATSDGECYTQFRISGETRLVLPKIPSATNARFFRVVVE